MRDKDKSPDIAGFYFSQGDMEVQIKRNAGWVIFHFIMVVEHVEYSQYPIHHDRDA